LLREGERLRLGVRLMVRPRLRLLFLPFRAGDRSSERRRSIEGEREGERECSERGVRSWSSSAIGSLALTGESMMP
jgi:hypothetical protein